MLVYQIWIVDFEPYSTNFGGLNPVAAVVNCWKAQKM